MLVNDLVALGELIRRTRQVQQLSQTALAEKVGSTRQWVSRLEKGKNDITTARLFAVLDALELNLDIRPPQAAQPSWQTWETATQRTTSPRRAHTMIPSNALAALREHPAHTLVNPDALAGITNTMRAVLDQMPRHEVGPDALAGMQNIVRALNLNLEKLKGSTAPQTLLLEASRRIEERALPDQKEAVDDQS